MPDEQAVAVLEPGYADYATEKAVLADFNVRIVPVAENQDAVSGLTQINPVAVMVRERPVTPSVIDCCPNLKVIVRYGVGVDNVDLQTAAERGVYVANVPDYGAEQEVSEHAVALYLAVQRRVLSRNRDVRQGKWGIGQTAMIPGRENAVLGLIGCGRIGLETARKFRALCFRRVIAFDPYLNPQTAAAERIELVDLDTLCAASDVISLHAPLTPETKHILDAKRIARIGRTSIVINVSRGGLIDEIALAAALNDGRIFGAGIDVFEHEPPAAGNPLLSSPNTVLSDHSAWYSERSVEVLQRNAALEIRRVLDGHPPKSWINRW